MPLPKEQHLVTLIPRSCNIEQMSDRDTNVARSEGLLKVRCWAWSFEERFRPVVCFVVCAGLPSGATLPPLDLKNKASTPHLPPFKTPVAFHALSWV